MSQPSERAQKIKDVFDGHLRKGKQNNKYQPSSSLLQSTFQTMMHALPDWISLSKFKQRKPLESRCVSSNVSFTNPSPCFGQISQYQRQSVLQDIKNNKKW